MVYIGNNGKAASVSSIKVGGADGKSQNVVGGWAGDESGKAQRIWNLDRPMWKFTCQNGVSLHVGGSELAIDYGDGASESIGTVDEYHFFHIYADAEPRQVILYGVLSYVRFWYGTDEESAKNYLLSVDTPFPKNRIARFSNAFYGCTSLTSIPAGLFDNCPKVTIFDSTFYGCTSLTSIPAGLFDNCPKVTNFYNAFRNCTAITSAVPELWNTAKWPNVTNHGDCFRECTHAANYADIPTEWK